VVRVRRWDEACLRQRSPVRDCHHEKAFEKTRASVFRKVAVTTWRIIVAGAAFVAVTLVVYVCWTAIQQPGHVGIRIILRVGLVCGGLMVMAFVMVSYLARRLRMKKLP